MDSSQGFISMWSYVLSTRNLYGTVLGGTRSEIVRCEMTPHTTGCTAHSRHTAPARAEAEGAPLHELAPRVQKGQQKEQRVHKGQDNRTNIPKRDVERFRSHLRAINTDTPKHKDSLVHRCS